MTSTAYLGPAGTFTEAAALLFTGGQQPLISHSSIQGTLRAVLQKEVTYGVVPAENSVEGSVGLTLDCLWNLDGLHIQTALELPITHALMGFGKLDQIHKVYSHPQALAQCQGWLEVHLPQVEQIPTASTTEALHCLSASRHCGVISSPRAAQLQRIPILAQPINDYPDNRTRFWVVGREPSVGERLSLAFSPQQKGPGVLVQALQVFAVRGINLTRIESRPSKKVLGEYVFFLDLEGGVVQNQVQSALTELSPLTERLKILGSYTIRPSET